MTPRNRAAVGVGRPEFAYVILGYVEMFPEGVHGYRLGRMLARSPLGLSTLRLGQVYRALRHLERADLVRSRIDAGGSRPARHRFTITLRGATAFRRWLTTLPCGWESMRDSLLNRLRFVDRIPAPVLCSLLNEAASAWDAELEEFRRRQSAGGKGEADINPLHARLLEARVAADRRWLDDVRSLVERLYARERASAALDTGT